ncbi:hypothetical protein ZIOFF_027987 [Zingiber officinale]|uniref:Helicase C-terminal domain-containing protein n=1 Tax=Zingiber officinale TaxID=94328 RepID=A0A8J5GTR2_ZINOF|nr:hypothetical protein ZIOFF_027987 [Zingiber officinale]
MSSCLPDKNKLKRRGGLIVAPLLPTSPFNPKASKSFNEDLENQDPNQSTPSRLPRQTKTRNAVKDMIKSSVGKKVEEEREEPKPEKLPPRLKSTMSARNLFSRKDLLSQISNKLKIVIEKSTFPKDVRANPPTPQRFPSPCSVKNAKAIANGRSPLNSKPERAVLQEGCSNVSVAGDSGGTTTDLFSFLKSCSYLEYILVLSCLLRPALLLSRLLLPNPSTFQWNTIIRACSSCHFPRESLNLFCKMRQKSTVPDAYTFYEFFGVYTTIIGGLVKSRFVDDARKLFNEMPVRNVVFWTSLIAGYAKDGRASDVENELPKKIERLVRCEAFAYQKLLMKRVEENLGSLRSAKVPTLSFLLFQLMQVDSFLPKHFLPPIIRLCGKLKMLDSLLPKLKATGHQVLFFSTMMRLLDVMEDYLCWKRYRYLCLDGHTFGLDRGALVDEFNRSDSQEFIFLLSIRAGGVGVNLQATDTVILFDTDWNPQAILTSWDPIFITIVHTVEEQVRAAAEHKLGVANQSITIGFFDNNTRYITQGQFMRIGIFDARSELCLVSRLPC